MTSWRGLWALPGAILTYLVAAFIGALIPNGEHGGGEGAVTVYFLNGPIHYDILLPADPVTRAKFGFAQQAGVPIDAPAVEWIVVGWGSRAFYTSAHSYTDISARALWSAVTGDDSVLRIAVAGDISQLPAREIRVTIDEYSRLRAAILASVPEARPIAGAGFSRWDAFFEARGRFHLFRTCNVWLAGVMREAGLRFGRWTPTPYAVTFSRWLYQGRG